MFKIWKLKKLQHPEAFSCHNAKTDLVKHLPKKFIESSAFLAKVRTGFIGGDDLAFACNIISKLASYEGMNTGYFCTFNRSIFIPKNNGNKNVYLLKDCIITCRKTEREDVIKKIEKAFFEKYKIRIKLEFNENSNKNEFFSFYTIEVLTTYDTMCILNRLN